ncbi:hypothetical protein ABFU65_12205 [Xanthomonas campestris pv. raphani]|uniref:hypothetical protein n=1 Tax=Xanthomonas campestris TaxID=339 RepID=UPI002B23C2F0|nr:hypothetical protein [Xanthomonas campestris]MEB1025971.1 hypothetical protein [Xanthomonas campestris pv. campestris]MEA9653040.1 hypothetical protein [Xanthomonas campestris pv. raphani]MEB1134266.1 hypothetical protein [Xanthomonas campestris pv. campestris]MEB1146732.1 hypothetical protein [Xanthomonas campestris pv. campestris]MEB1937045.1 hypothetical protein [Xanthomonas campestris pv. campestris]
MKTDINSTPPACDGSLRSHMVDLHQHLLDMLGAKDHADAGRIVGELQGMGFDRARETPRRQSAVELLLSLGYVWRTDRWEAPQPGAAALNEHSGNSGQLPPDAGSAGDALIDVTDPWRGLYRPEQLRANGDGDMYHPDLPSWPDDREDALDKLVHAQGFDFQIFAGDFSDEAIENGDELYWQEMRAWNPEAPEGEWRLAWKGDTEDGPYAWFVRPMALRPEPEEIAARQPVGEPLWCMHILGPDDVHAAPSKAHAEKAAAALNAFHAARAEQSEHHPKVEAVVAPWPHSVESHAESVADFIPGWLLPRWQVEAIQTNTAPPAPAAVPVDGSRDSQRLDFLDRMNATLNARHGTNYGWRLILSPQIVRLMAGTHAGGYVGDIDLNDSHGGNAKLSSCRAAIDSAMLATHPQPAAAGGDA